jgi:hypothetical protein
MDLGQEESPSASEMDRGAERGVPERENMCMTGREGQTAATGSRKGRFDARVNTT